MKAVEKDDALKKKKKSEHWLWMGENRARIVTMLGSSYGPDVSKKGAEMWQVLSDVDRKP